MHRGASAPCPTGLASAPYSDGLTEPEHGRGGQVQGTYRERVDCTACGTPLDPALAAAGHRTHAGCEPGDGQEGGQVEHQPATAPIKTVSTTPRLPARIPDPSAGPCAVCRQPCTRYGPHGRPLCPTCQASAAPARN